MRNLLQNNTRHLLTLGFVFVVVLSMCVPQFLFAQTATQGEIQEAVINSNSSAAEIGGSDVGDAIINDQVTSRTTQEEVRAADPTVASVGGNKKAGGMGVFETIGRWIGNLLLSIASMFVYIGGTVLDLALTKVVFGMGDLVNRSGFGNSIDTMWKLIRDICNLAFIFAFVFLGIRTIISPDSSSVKRTLAQIIIGALLINFSLFFVKFIIDFSNLTAYHIYNAMISGSGSLSAKMADMLGIVSIFKSPNPDAFANISGAGGMIWFYILGALLLFIAAFVFIAAAILLVIRFVALILIMIASPILFAATLFPQTAQYSSNLWRQLISYSFFAPVYLLLTLITITLMQGLGAEISPSGSGFVDAVKNPANGGLDSMGVILNFVIIIFFLIQSFMIARRIGIAGGNATINGVQRAAAFLPRVAGRYAVGEMSRRTLNRFDRWQARDPQNQSAVGRMARATLATTNLDRTIRGGLTTGTQATMGLGHSYQQNRDYRRERGRRINQNMAQDQREEAFNNAVTTSSNMAATDAEVVAAVTALNTTMRQMSDAERADLDVNILTNERVAINLNDKHIESLEKSGNYSPQEIQNIRTARTNGRNNIATTGDARTGHNQRRVTGNAVYAQEQRQNLLQGSADTIGNLPHEVFARPEMVQYVTPAMIEARMKNGATNVQLQAIKQTVDNHLNNPATSQPVVRAWQQWMDHTTYGAQFASI